MERGNSQGLENGNVRWIVSGDGLMFDEMDIIDRYISEALAKADVDVRVLRQTKHWWDIISKEMMSMTINPLKPPNIWEVSEYIGNTLRVRYGALSVRWNVESTSDNIVHIVVEVEPGVLVHQRIKAGILSGNKSKQGSTEHSIATSGR